MPILDSRAVYQITARFFLCLQNVEHPRMAVASIHDVRTAEAACNVNDAGKLIAWVTVYEHGTVGVSAYIFVDNYDQAQRIAAIINEPKEQSV